jgi:hypothetical protein
MVSFKSSNGNLQHPITPSHAIRSERFNLASVMPERHLLLGLLTRVRRAKFVYNRMHEGTPGC